MKSFLLLVILVLLFPLGLRGQPALTDATIVVYNKDVSESAALAKFYAQKRGIAADHLVGLSCATEEEISREDYERTISDPLREIFRKRRWWTLRDADDSKSAVTASTIRFVALIKGMPLKIRAAENYPGDKVGDGPIGNRNEAAVDSELSLLPRIERTISGAINNPYFKSYRRVLESPELPVLLVCRLDAPSAATVRKMIVDGIETEKKGLWGRAFVDGAHNGAAGYEVGDQWLREVVQQLRKVGVPAVYDDAPAVFGPGYPMSDCALYYGWYAGDMVGPFTQPDFRFVPGAIAVHIHSFSANTLRNPAANWVGPLLTKGAAASLGNVYEPYLQLTHHLEVFNDRLLHGFTFAESAYMSVPALSWMEVMVGDPLYRPYGSWLQIQLKSEARREASDWTRYHEFALQNSELAPAEYRKKARAAASRANNGAMIEDLGLMEVKDGNYAAAISYFQQARTVYTQRDDIIRVVLAQADGLIKKGEPKRALELVRSVLKIVSGGPTADLLKQLEQELDPAPPGATPRP
ncbi:MAG: TIGR03790 family protein [Chthoniobacterales bacterium]